MKVLLIEPFGIETSNLSFLIRSEDILLIEPFGIETRLRLLCQVLSAGF